MEYIFIPNSIDNKKENFAIQIKYKNEVEKLLSKFIEFSMLDDKIREVSNVFPVDDYEYNFYHKFSVLKSDYIFLRNNIHIENLTPEEQEKIKNNEISDEFILETIPKVLFEDSGKSFFGKQVLEYLANSKSIVFEIAYSPNFELNSHKYFSEYYLI